MKAGRELDALIGERVMGLKNIRSQDGLMGPYLVHGEPINDNWAYALTSPGLPGYSTDIAAAWEVVEKLKSHMPSVQLTENFGDFFYLATFYKAEASADTAPLAICLAALKAVS